MSAAEVLLQSNGLSVVLRSFDAGASASRLAVSLAWFSSLQCRNRLKFRTSDSLTLVQAGRCASQALQVTLRLVADALEVNFVADQAGSLTWPTVAPTAAAKGWILPMFEGVYVPADDDRWTSFLEKSGPLDTTADLILPFWGLDYGDFTMTCILLNPFNNQIEFDKVDGRLRMRLTHEFTRNQPVKQFGLRVAVGAASPIEPAREYRRWLQANGGFVSLREKIRRTAEAEKLLGAAHVYLWGDGLLHVDDVRDWNGFCRPAPRTRRSRCAVASETSLVAAGC